MPTRHLGSLAKNSSTRLRDNFCRKATCPAASTPCTRKTDFAISNPIVVTCFIVVLLSTHPQIMLREGRESRPHHQKRKFRLLLGTARLRRHQPSLCANTGRCRGCAEWVKSTLCCPSRSAL